MKYIRTKDGRIFEVMSGPDENEWYEQKDGIICLPKKKILKQADNIEELCDEFVVEHDSNLYNDNGRDIYYQVYGRACHRGDSYYDFTFEQIRTGRIEMGGTLCGAIWTDKGLIYVAKMNDKGELCLL